MPTTTPPVAPAASKPLVVERAVHRDSVAGVVRWLGLATLTSVGAVVVAGAFAADIVEGDDVAVVVVAAVAAILVPLIVGVLAARRKPAPIARAVRVVSGVQLVALLALVAFAATPMAEALRHHGHWPARVVGADDVVSSAMAVEIAERLSPAPVVEASIVVVTKPTAAPLPSTPKEVFAARAGSVVVVQVRQSIGRDNPLAALVGDGEVEGHGSGFVVDGGLIVTNHHVIGQASSARIRFADGRVFDTVRVLVDDASNDLALLAIDGEIGAPPAPLSTVEAVVGDRVVVIGSPLGLDFSLSSGLVSARREQSGTQMLQIDATIAPGSSGGPVFDEHGTVIGVATAMRGAGLGFAVSASNVHALLKAERKERVLTKWVGGFQLTALDVEGAAITPTSRANLLEALQHLQQSTETCVLGRPAGELVVAVKGRALDAGKVTKKAKACFEGMPSMIGKVIELILLPETPKPAKITARYAAEDGRTTVLVYEPSSLSP